MLNQTGYTVTVTAPTSTNIPNAGRHQFQPTDTNRSINVTYRIENIEFTEQVNMNNADATVTLTRRPPSLIVVNQTGHAVSLSSPRQFSLQNGERTQFLPPVLNQNIEVAYTIGQMQFTERVNMSNQDVTVNLTRRPPNLTILNNTGLTVNMIFMRRHGTERWHGGNITRRADAIVLTEAGGTAQAGDMRESIINGDRMVIWTGNIPLSGDRFDIRIEAVGGGGTFVRSNVHITGDMSLTFTTRDRP